ncbi:Plant calmodulin-binding protein-related [Abeliophyllum distichum]|uniref:Plant calmodulin-binding protein-related n=1 Tax=Abeliophyllum distichum TaxID=126358 RepID=A0ABD1SJM5_9LAMI
MPWSDEKTKTVSNKHSPSLQSKTVTVRLSSSPDTSDGINGKGRRNSAVKTGGKMMASKASVKKAFAPLPTSASPKISFSRTMSLKARKVVSLKVMSPLKDRSRIRKAETKRSSNEKIPEKTLHVIRTDMRHVVPSRPSPSSLKSVSRAKLPSLLCHEEDKEETEYDKSEVDEMISDAADVGKVKLVKEKHIRKIRAVGSEDRDGTPVKLKFRRGKVVDLKSDNNNPRILRFRRGRVLVEDQDGKGDLRRKTFKTGVVNDDKNDADCSSEKVVLKHQNMQGKKDAQGLFNNVIEETASKLVESRKSKVKALVGAFETCDLSPGE